MAGPVIIREVEEDEARSFLANSQCAPPRYVLVDAHRPECAHYVADNLGLIPSGGNRIEWALNDWESIHKKYGTELVGVPDEAILKCECFAGVPDGCALACMEEDRPTSCEHNWNCPIRQAGFSGDKPPKGCCHDAAFFVGMREAMG